MVGGEVSERHKDRDVRWEMNGSTASAFQRARTAHESGDLSQAEQIYREIIAA